MPLPHLPAPPQSMALETPPPAPVAAPAGRLSTAEAILIAFIVGLIFSAAVVLKLNGMHLGEELELLSATGAIAAFVVAAATGRLSPRNWMKSLGKLAQDD
ncbi:hypothetical protein ACFW3D_32015 [Streptomyces sp. NPDC058864]